jgi:hypothetical protein
LREFRHELTEELSVWAAQLTDGQPLDLEHLEHGARAHALSVTAQLLEAALNRDPRDYRGPALRCSCGEIARYAGRRAKRIVTLVGEITLERAYYHCSGCGHGFCPRDTTLRIGNGSLSEGVLRMVGTTASLVSFAEASALLGELAGVAVEAKQVERAAERLGRDITDDEHTTVQAAPPGSSTMYLGMDGTGLPMRHSELAGRRGKQADGSAKTREAKLVTIWTADTRDNEGTPVRDAGSISYSAAIESAAMPDTAETLSQFACRVEREARRRGFDAAERRVVIGDGARWIWNIASELFPEAIQIVDLYHAKGTLWDVAKALFGPTSERTEEWAKQRRDELDNGNLAAILRALEPHLTTSQEARTCREYLILNQDRLDYPRFRRMGLCTSSGVVEAGCKLAVGTRLKRAGMHWTVAGANAIMALRACRLSGRYDSYWERRYVA